MSGEVRVAEEVPVAVGLHVTAGSFGAYEKLATLLDSWLHVSSVRSEPSAVTHPGAA